MSLAHGLVLVPTEPDADRVERAVERINEITGRKALEAAIEVGRYIVEEFYEGSLDQYRSRGAKDTALRAIAAHPDMTLSASWLASAVAVASSVAELGDAVAMRLSYSHHVELIRVPDPDRRRELAHRTLAEGLSVRDLRETRSGARDGQERPTRQNQPTRDPGGGTRSPEPDFDVFEQLRLVERALDGDIIEAATADDEDGVDALVRRVDEALEAAVNIQHALRRIRAKFRRRSLPPTQAR